VLAGIARKRWLEATGEDLTAVSVEGDPWPESIEPQIRNVDVGIACTVPAVQPGTGVRDVEQLYLDMIERAQRYIYIENQYFTAQKIGAALVISDSLFQSNRRRLVDLAARNIIPTMYPWRDFAVEGGLLSYGDSLNDAGRHIGLYAGRILKGDRAGDLPVWVPTKFEFVLNLKTAKALGLAIPASLLAFADEVIE